MRRMRAGLATTTLLLCMGLAAGTGVRAAPPAPTEPESLEAAVARMARIGTSYWPSLSPDGTQVAYVSNLSGVFQVWTIASAGGHPRLVTAFDDPVGAVEWSRDGRWLAFDVLPGGGLNAQVYLARPDGSEVRRITGGGEVNYGLGNFTDDGRWLTYTSNERDPAAPIRTYTSWLPAAPRACSKAPVSRASATSARTASTR